MMAPCAGIDWDNLRVAIPSFLCITIVPFTYSIHNGIIAGMLMDLFLGCLSREDSSVEEATPPQSPYTLASSGASASSKTVKQVRRLLREKPLGSKLSTPRSSNSSTACSDRDE